jgi:pimeloyl-ACP methyl ester carboxylesterase
LKKEIQKIGKGPAEIILLAHSFGGQVSAKMLAENPGIVGKVVFTAPAVFRMKASIRRFLFGTIAKVGKFTLGLPPLSRFETLGKKVLYRMADSPDYGNTDGVQREIFKKVIHEDVSHFLSDIKIPTLLVWGNRDRYVPVSRAKRMQRLMPQATLEIIPKATHGIHLSHSERLLDLITRFSQ